MTMTTKTTTKTNGNSSASSSSSSSYSPHKNEMVPVWLSRSGILVAFAIGFSFSSVFRSTRTLTELGVSSIVNQYNENNYGDNRNNNNIINTSSSNSNNSEKSEAHTVSDSPNQPVAFSRPKSSSYLRQDAPVELPLAASNLLSSELSAVNSIAQYNKKEKTTIHSEKDNEGKKIELDSDDEKENVVKIPMPKETSSSASSVVESERPSPPLWPQTDSRYVDYIMNKAIRITPSHTALEWNETTKRSYYVFNATLQCEAPQRGLATVVTAYYDMPSKHSSVEYKGWIKNFLSRTTDPMVIFVDPKPDWFGNDWVAFVKEHRQHAETLIVPLPFENFTMGTRFSDTFWKSEIMPRDKSHRRRKGVDVYKIWNEKIIMMHEVASLNPFETDHFVWLDAGYFRKPLPREPQPIVRNNFTKNGLDPSQLLFQNVKNQLAAGAWGGTAEAIQQGYKRYFEIFWFLVRSKEHEHECPGYEQRVMVWMCRTFPDTCNMHQDGDWFIMGRNWMRDQSFSFSTGSSFRLPYNESIDGPRFVAPVPYPNEKVIQSSSDSTIDSLKVEAKVVKTLLLNSKQAAKSKEEENSKLNDAWPQLDSRYVDLMTNKAIHIPCRFNENNLEVEQDSNRSYYTWNDTRCETPTRRLATIVTAYYDMPSKHAGHDYKIWFQNFLSRTTDPMVLFVDPKPDRSGFKWVAFANEHRQHAETLIVPLPFENFTMGTRFSDNFWKAEVMPRDKSKRPKMGVDVYKIWNEKIIMMHEVASLNPFTTDHFVWLDAGYFRKPLSREPTPIIRNNFTKNGLDPSQLLFQNVKTELAAGAWGGTAKAIQLAYKRYFEIFWFLVRSKEHKHECPGYEQRVMVWMCRTYPDLCNIHQSGDWFKMGKNWMRVESFNFLNGSSFRLPYNESIDGPMIVAPALSYPNENVILSSSDTTAKQ